MSLTFAALTSAAALLLLQEEEGQVTQTEERPRTRKRKLVFGHNQRSNHSQYFNWFAEVGTDHELYNQWARMKKEKFEELLAKISDHPLMKKKHSNFKRPISPGERLALVLR